MEDTLVLEDVRDEQRIVSASELSVLMVDIDIEDERREDAVDALSDPELEEVATPMSCL